MLILFSFISLCEQIYLNKSRLRSSSSDFHLREASHISTTAPQRDLDDLLKCKSLLTFSPVSWQQQFFLFIDGTGSLLKWQFSELSACENKPLQLRLT